MNLIDRNKLIEELGDSAYCDFCRRNAEFCNCHVCLDDALDKWINAQPIVNEWIPVERELPKDTDDVWAICKFGDVTPPVVAFYERSTWHEAMTTNIIKVIAWMPIPEYKEADR